MRKYSQLVLVTFSGLVLGQPWLSAWAASEEIHDPSTLPSGTRLFCRKGDFPKVPIIALLNSAPDRRIKLLGKPINNLGIEFPNEHMSSKWIRVKPAKVTYVTVKEMTYYQVLDSDLLKPGLNHKLGRLYMNLCTFPFYSADPLSHQAINDFLQGKTDCLNGYDARAQRHQKAP